MSKRRILIVIIILIILIIAILLAIIGIKLSENNIKEKGFEIFENDYCSGHSAVTISAEVITSWTCKLCGYSSTYPNSDAPIICSDCADLTGRCTKCGKLRN